MTPASQPDPAAADPRTPFERFRDLTRRILTTPKADVMKNVPPAKSPPKKRRKR